MAREKLSEHLSTKRGQIPGDVKYVGRDLAHKVSVELLCYNPSGSEIKTIDADEIHKLSPSHDCNGISWINLSGVHDTQLLEKIGKQFDLHPLVIEDIANTSQRPKYELHEKYIYIVLKMLKWDSQHQETTIEQVSLILGENFVLSFQQRSGDVFDQIRERISNGYGRIRKMKADYLCYSLLDAIIDEYFVILEHRAEQIETLEDEVISTPQPQTLKQLYKLKREGLFLRKSLWPMREIVSHLERSESQLLGTDTAPYFRDVYDHVIQVIDTMETMRDMLSGMMDTYLSSLSNRMNEVMKVLTIISTIFIPLTFIAGIYGMNFDYMPECRIKWAYPAVMVVMLIMAGIMFIFFRRKKWL